MYKQKILVAVLILVMTLPLAAPLTGIGAQASITPISPPGKSDVINTFKGQPVKYSGEIINEVMAKLSPKILDTTYLQGIMETMLFDNKDYTTFGLIVNIGLDDFDEGLRSLKKVVDRYGDKYASITQVWPKLGMAFVEVDSSNPSFVMRLATAIATIGAVDYVDVNDLAHITIFDSHYLLQTAQVYSALGVNGTGVTVAVLDTGIEEAHPELNGSVIAWADFVNGQPDPYDDEGHGTFVAGIIAARGVLPWTNGNGVWHSINFNDDSEFNYPGTANLTYAIDVAAYAGSNVTLNFTQRYWIESGFDYGYVYYWFDSNTTPVELASYTGTNFTLHTESFNISVDAGATTLYISFQYDPDFSVQYGGWWLDDIIVYNASDPADIIFVDDVEGPMPPEVVNSYLWSRTTNRLMGMAPGASLVGVKVCDSGGSCTTTAILSGIEFAINQSVDIISMSLGGPVAGYDSMMTAIDIANYVYNITPVIAAGNEGPGYYTIASPAAAMGAIAVGAATKTNTIAWFSSKGPNPVNYDIKPDITAYGRYIISTIAAQPFGYPPGTYLFASGSGTSFSTPMVSGLVALIKQAHPDWSPEMIRSALISTATDLEYSSYTGAAMMNPYVQGGGLANIWRAINTQFLPIPAKVSFGSVDARENLTSLINLISLDPGVTTATVAGLELYALDGTDVSSWIVSPAVGDTITLNGTLNLTVSIPANPIRDMLYWGRVNLSVAGDYYQVIFGFYIPQYYWVNGTVYDVVTGAPLAGVAVYAVSPDLSITYNATVTNATGQFSMLVRGGDIRIQASIPTGYYEYYSTVFTLDDNITYDVFMTPRVSYNPLNALVVYDSFYGMWTGSPLYAPDMTPVLALNGTLGINMTLWNTTIQQVAVDAILSGDFPVVAWFSGGIWYPFADSLDAIGLIIFSLFYDGGLLVEGGEIGWFWGGSIVMQYVAHANFVSDLGKSVYEINITRSHPLTWFLPATSFTINTSTGAIGQAYPDQVVPAYGGFDIANWSIIGDTAIVAYDGRPTGESRTVYYAFPYDAILDPVMQAALLNYTLIWLFDRGAPVYTSPSVNVSINVVTGTATAYWTIFDDQPFNIVSYNLYLNGTMIASNLPASTTSFDLTPYVTPGNYYIFTIEAVDVLNETTRVDTWFYMMPPGLTGAAFGYPYSGVFSGTAPVGGGATFTINVSSAPVGLQLLELDSLPANAWNALPAEADVLYFDVAMVNASGASWLVINITYPEPAPPLTEDIVPMWFDGTMWREVSHYSVDPASNTVTIWINATGTSPTLADLTGTPFRLYSMPAPLVGGEAIVSASGTPLAIAMVGVALLLVALASRRR